MGWPLFFPLEIDMGNTPKHGNLRYNTVEAMLVCLGVPNSIPLGTHSCAMAYQNAFWRAQGFIRLSASIKFVPADCDFSRKQMKCTDIDK